MSEEVKQEEVAKEKEEENNSLTCMVCGTTEDVFGIEEGVVCFDHAYDEEAIKTLTAVAEDEPADEAISERARRTGNRRSRKRNTIPPPEEDKPQSEEKST